jgi:hypothetical protein
MKLRLALVVFCLLAVLASHVVQRSGASAGSNARRQANLAGIEKFHQRDIAATLSRDPVALTNLWTDDAVRLGPGRPAEVGKKAIRERATNAGPLSQGSRMLSYVPETKDLTILKGWGSGVGLRPRDQRGSNRHGCRNRDLSGALRRKLS